jgi:hypothetical protein
MSVKTSVTQDKALGEPVILTESAAVTFQINVPGTNAPTSPTMTMYKQNSGSDISSTYFAGSMSVSGMAIITKTTQNLKAGEYIINIDATVGGNTYTVYRFPLIVKRKSTV